MKRLTARLAIFVGLVCLLLILGDRERGLAPAAVLIILATSVWAAVDSDRVNIRRYNTRLAMHPLLLLNAMYCLWPILFPWYLVVSSKIRDGTLATKQIRAAPGKRKPDR